MHLFDLDGTLIRSYMERIDKRYDVVELFGALSNAGQAAAGSYYVGDRLYVGEGFFSK
jgi:hypothetical protein